MRNIKVLLVDDDTQGLLALRQALIAEGYEVVMARNVKAALDEVLASEQPFDIIVTDLCMSPISGVDLLHTLSRSVPIIIVSAAFGEGKNPTQKEVEALGAVATFAMPYEVTDLLKAIEDHLPIPVGTAN